MAKSRSSKVATANSLSQSLTTAKGIVMADFTGLGVKDLQELRKILRDKGISYEVVKRTVLKRSLVSAGLKEASEVSLPNGSVSLAVSQVDEVEAAKLLADYGKSHDKFKILGGILEKVFVNADKVNELAKLPSKQELLGQVVGTIAAPLSGFVNVLQGNLRGLVQVFKAMSSK
ncbi:50S ribosomal protein L10 [Patescibacteria group bacterium]|nr:50S ribosomal protein L10 [Patescibacteria group bacterium]